jgi:hypothetical protein
MNRIRSTLSGALGLIGTVSLTALPAGAQPADRPVNETVTGAAGESALRRTVLPFSPGERLEYGVTVARVRLGQGVLSVEAQEEMHGVPTYRLALEVEIKAPFLRFSDREVSWLATDPFRSVVFERERREGDRQDRRRYLFDHEALLYKSEVWDPATERFRTGSGDGARGRIPAGALDEIAALFVLRTLFLEPGAVHTIDTYLDGGEGAIVFRVIGRERVKVPAGRFDVVVVEPDIPALGPFRAEKNARIYMTDDAAHVIVKITTRTKVGPLTFYLREVVPGASR